MKKIFIFIFVLHSIMANAQWAGTDPIYSGNKKVIVGSNTSYNNFYNFNSQGTAGFFSTTYMYNAPLYLYNNSSGSTYTLLQNTGISTTIKTTGTQSLKLGTNNIDRLIINSSGNVGIGTQTPSAMLHVNGTALMGVENDPKAVRVLGGICVVPTASQFCPDYVFEKDYPLRSIEEMDRFIRANKHLPGVKSAKEVTQSDNGVNMIDMSYSLLEKVEELSLYIIQLNDRIKALEKDNEVLIKMAKEKGN